MSTHPIGRGVIDLIKQHEPAALQADPGACLRVLLDLGDSAGGIIAFILASKGPDEATAAAMMLIDRMRVAAPNVVRKAEAELSARQK